MQINTTFASLTPPIKLSEDRTLKYAHPEWAAHHVKWRWLLDSYEGGDAYRYAVYDAAMGAMSSLPGVLTATRNTYNLIPHKHDYDGPWGGCLGEDYALRLMRTPVPTFVPEVVDKHLGKIFNKQISREGSERLESWWDDVDGKGSSMDHYMSTIVAPLLLVEGNLDLIFGRPLPPEGVTPKTRADDIRYGLDGVVMSHVLPENVLWWKLDKKGRYLEVLIREVAEDGTPSYAYADEVFWRRFDAKGNQYEGKDGLWEHGFGRVPMVRVFDDPKRTRCTHVGMPRYESIAELQREYYNRDSELILSDTTQAHPNIQGPEEWCRADAEVPVGPGRMLAMKRVAGATGTTSSYQGYEYIDPPKGAADSLRANLDRIRDAVDRAASLVKPAGASGTGAGTVSQSGISKEFDYAEGNELLGEIADVLKRCEEIAAEFAAVGLGEEVDPSKPAAKITYPKSFDLFSLEDRLMCMERLIGITPALGALPITEAYMLKDIAAEALMGHDDADVKESADEIDAYLESQATQRQQEAEAATQVNTDLLAGGTPTGEVAVDPQDPNQDPNPINASNTR